jgi:hypothetical protein
MGVPNLNTQGLSSPEAENLIPNFGDCLLRDADLRGLAESFPSALFETEIQNFVTRKLVGWMLTAHFGPGATNSFLEVFGDVVVHSMVNYSQPIPVLDRPMEELYRRLIFFAAFELVADSSCQDLIRCLGGVEGVGSLLQRYLFDEEFQRRAVGSYCSAFAHEVRKFDFKKSLGLMINDLPTISAQGWRSKSLLDFLPSQPREIASIFLDRADAKSAADSFYQRWLNWLRTKSLSGLLPPHMNPAQSIEDARPHWRSALNLVVAKLNRQFHLKPTSLQIEWLTSERHWQDVIQRLQDEVKYTTAVNARGPLYAGEDRAELIFLDGPADEEDFDGDHCTLQEVFWETRVQPDHNIDPLTGQMIVLAIERDYDSFVDILGATGTEVLRLKSLHEGDISSSQIAQQIGRSERTVRREGQKRERLEQPVVSNVRKILKIG